MRPLRKHQAFPSQPHAEPHLPPSCKAAAAALTRRAPPLVPEASPLVVCFYYGVHKLSPACSWRWRRQQQHADGINLLAAAATSHHSPILHIYLTAADCILSQGRSVRQRRKNRKRKHCVWVCVCVFTQRGLFLPHVQELKGGDPQRQEQNNSLFLDCG